MNSPSYEPDDIDKICLSFEQPVSAVGDHIADEFLNVVDLTTTREPLEPVQEARLASAIRRVNRNFGFVETSLDVDGLLPVYRDLARQVNDINAQTGHKTDPLILEADPGAPKREARFYDFY